MAKKQFEMDASELEEIYSIARNQLPVMKFGNYWSGSEHVDRANAFWQLLAKKYGFVWDSAESAGTGNNAQFLAEPI